MDTRNEGLLPSPQTTSNGKSIDMDILETTMETQTKRNSKIYCTSSNDVMVLFAVCFAYNPHQLHILFILAREYDVQDVDLVKANLLALPSF
jgi:hypothetical protein